MIVFLLLILPFIVSCSSSPMDIQLIDVDQNGGYFICENIIVDNIDYTENSKVTIGSSKNTNMSINLNHDGCTWFQLPSSEDNVITTTFSPHPFNVFFTPIRSLKTSLRLPKPIPGKIIFLGRITYFESRKSPNVAVGTMGIATAIFFPPAILLSASTSRLLAVSLAKLSGEDLSMFKEKFSNKKLNTETINELTLLSPEGSEINLKNNESQIIRF